MAFGRAAQKVRDARRGGGVQAAVSAPSAARNAVAANPELPTDQEAPDVLLQQSGARPILIALSQQRHCRCSALPPEHRRGRQAGIGATVRRLRQPRRRAKHDQQARKAHPRGGKINVSIKTAGRLVAVGRARRNSTGRIGAHRLRADFQLRQSSHNGLSSGAKGGLSWSRKALLPRLKNAPCSLVV